MAAEPALVVGRWPRSFGLCFSLFFFFKKKSENETEYQFVHDTLVGLPGWGSVPMGNP